LTWFFLDYWIPWDLCHCFTVNLKICVNLNSSFNHQLDQSTSPISFLNFS
jgi:hypothetical protein